MLSRSVHTPASTTDPTPTQADALELAALQQLLKQEVLARIALGERSRSRGDIAESELHWAEAARAQESIGDNDAAAKSYRVLADIAWEMQNPDKRLFYLDRCLQLSDPTTSPIENIEARILQAETHLYLENAEAARAVLENAVEIANLADLPLLEAEAYTALIHVCLFQNNVTAAASMAVRALDALVTEESVEHYVHLGIGLAALLCQTDEHMHAASVLAKCGLLANEAELAVDIDRISAMHKRVFAAIGDDTNARECGEHWSLTEFVRTMGRLIRHAVMPINILLISVPAGPAFPELTPREHEVLRLLTEGQSTQAMAERLCLSPRTVTTHLSHIMAKLNVTTRAELVAKAMRS